MFKTSERRFEYNINPQGDDLDRPRYAHYPVPSPATTTPLNKRASLNYSVLDDTRPAHDFPRAQEQRFESRGRAGSEAVMRRSSERATHQARPKNQYEESLRQNKKVYFGAEEHDTTAARDRSRNSQPIRDQNRRYNGEESFQQDLKADKGRKADVSDYGVNEKEIMEKIGRINRLNEEINNRLQRMLNKMDGA